MKKDKKDYCTKFPDKFLGLKLKGICKEHDEDYSKGGNDRFKYIPFLNKNRWEADAKLFHKVRKGGSSLPEKVAAPVVASVMWVGVRLFGWLHY